jgi:hypothetical protein
VSAGVRTITPTRYVAPLREGGSLPALVEADDDGLYVLKFRGAGQGPRALVAELLAGEVARGLGLPVPEIVFADLDPRIAVAEPDPEIQDLLAASEGLNLALDFLPGSLAHTALDEVDAQLAADIVWFDALVMNVDRTPRNPNLLRWHGALWLIDHGAAFFRHHGADLPGWDAQAVAAAAFPHVADHVLLPVAGSITAADERLGARLDGYDLQELRALIPPQWADPDPYIDVLAARLQAPRRFAEEAEDARP